MLHITIASLAALSLPFVRAADTVVQVGKGGLRFDPQTIQASAGDTVTFVFNPKAHSVTQSSFDTPCNPLEGGFDSGLVPVVAGSSELINRTFTVPQTEKPIWIYCKQQGPPNHCQSGMVFAINAPTSGNQTFEAFQTRAQGATEGNTSQTVTTAAASSTSAFVTPPPPSIATVTATVTVASSTWTTTYASWEGSPPPTPAAQPQDHKVLVGENNGLTFSPSNIAASIGDTVSFEFQTKNHSVTRSTFLQPCRPQVDTTPDASSTFFDSGFRPVTQGATSDFPTFQFRVNDTAPIWVYCKQGNHCGSGMVFSVNAIESGAYNFAAFQALARRINGTSTTSPGGTPSNTASSPNSSNTNSGNPNSAIGMSANAVPAALLAFLAAACTFAL